MGGVSFIKNLEHTLIRKLSLQKPGSKVSCTNGFKSFFQPGISFEPLHSRAFKN